MATLAPKPNADVCVLAGGGDTAEEAERRRRRRRQLKAHGNSQLNPVVLDDDDDDDDPVPQKAPREEARQRSQHREKPAAAPGISRRPAAATGAARARKQAEDDAMVLDDGDDDVEGPAKMSPQHRKKAAPRPVSTRPTAAGTERGVEKTPKRARTGSSRPTSLDAAAATPRVGQDRYAPHPDAKNTQSLVKAKGQAQPLAPDPYCCPLDSNHETADPGTEQR